MEAKLAHLVFRTRRFTEMVDWYCWVFEARVQHRDERLAFLSHDEEHHRFAIANLDAMGVPAPDAPAPDKVGLDHAAFTLPSAGALLDQYERLKEKGVKPYWCIHHGLTLSMYYRDPDENGVEFQVDCFDDPREAQSFIRGERFAANPVGARYDAEELLARRAAGASEQELLRYPAS